ncbi:MAG: hypothetical protein DKINENOH_05245 [bacterium]|nr:hypothetical protein [bacterium]
MRMVLDTNVLIAAFIARGLCSRLLEHCFERHELFTSEFIMDELSNNLVGKFHVNPNDVAAALDLLQSKMQTVTPVALKTPIYRDPEDDMILATALAAGAACIITGDKDLTGLKRLETIDILSPTDFIDYESRRP